MIDAQEFATWMGVFADVIGRPLTPPTQAAYYTILSGSLTTAQFAAAAQLVLERHRYNVWPKPGEFISAVTPAPAPEIEAGLAWDRVVAIVLGYRPSGTTLRQREAEVEDQVGPAARRALQAAGGAARLLRIDQAAHEWMRKEFCTHFTAVAEWQALEGDVARLGAPLNGRLADGRSLREPVPGAPRLIAGVSDRREG